MSEDEIRAITAHFGVRVSFDWATPRDEGTTWGISIRCPSLTVPREVDNVILLELCTAPPPQPVPTVQ